MGRLSKLKQKFIMAKTEYYRKFGELHDSPEVLAEREWERCLGVIRDLSGSPWQGRYISDLENQVKK